MIQQQDVTGGDVMYRVTTCLENLDISGNWPFVGKNIVFNEQTSVN